MLSFANATGNLYNRWGKYAALFKNVRSAQTTQYQAMVNTATGVVAQLNSEADIQAIMGNNYISILNAMGGNVGGTIQSLSSSTVNRMIFRDNPQLNQTLTSANLISSLVQVIQQMRVQVASILAMTVTTTPTAFTGQGNGQVVASNKRAFDGLVMENSFAENLTVTCTVDSYNGGATEGNETLQITGTGQQTDVFSFDWPLGSNAQVTVQAIDGNSDNNNGNELTNSGFEAWTGNVPDNWTLVQGTAGTDIVQQASIVYDGLYSMEFIGNGNATQVKQLFGSSTGTLGTLSPQTQYSFCMWARRGGSAGTGTITVDLVDSNDTVILDANSNSNTFNIDCSTLTVEFAAFTTTFRLPVILPSSIYLRIRTSVNLSAGLQVYMDKSGLGEMTQIYSSGPFAAVHSGSVPFVQGDYATIAVTNSRGAGGTLSTFQTFLYQAIPLVGSAQLLFPSSSSPTISDSLIG